MSLQRLGKIAIRFIQEVLKRQTTSNYLNAQKLSENALKKIGIRIGGRQIRLPQQLRRTLLRGFQRVARQKAPLLRPFATLHFHQQRLNELDQSRRRGFLHLKRHNGRRDVFERVRHIFGTNIRYNQALAVVEMPTTLDSYEFGKHIASGCNGAVYEARLASEEQQEMDSFSRYPLAIKLMFNYAYDRPEHLLWREMGPELVPLAPLPKALHGGRMLNIKTLPRSHPNLIKIHTAFIDRMPILADAKELYPDALPNLEDYEVLIKEPKTLFVVMKRYRMTLYEYVKNKKRNYWIGRVMFGQLLEAIVFLHQNKICHRDMKSDNILLEFDFDDEVPHLVLSDFGSALAIGDWILPYPNGETDLGGNLALRAPEVRKARHGKNAFIDYEMADTWAAGTLAFEIFTRRNPFYLILSSENYSESSLPPLPNRLISPIKRIIEEMLRVNPNQRPKPEVAANVIAISLFRFGKDLRQFLHSCGLQWYWSMENMRSTFSNVREQMDNKIRDLTELYSAETMTARLINPTVISSAELQLRATFLSRIDKDELRAGLEYFFDQTGNGMDGDGFFPQNWSSMSSYSSTNSSTAV